LKKAIQIDEKDNIATVTDEVNEGENVKVLSPEAEVIFETRPLEKILLGHKIALKDFDPGDEIFKYGEVIGVATKKIKTGQWVHTHNVESSRLPTKKGGLKDDRV
jgi:altronate dehydratase